MKLFFKIFFLTLISVANAQDKDVLTIAEKMPEFPGGMDSLAKYLIWNMRMPPIVREASASGKVYVNFIVDTIGRVGTVKIAKSCGYEDMDKEALRLVKAMPKWEPGMESGKKISVSMNIPIVYKSLNEVESKKYVEEERKAQLKEPLRELTPEEKENARLNLKAIEFFKLGMRSYRDGRIESALVKFDSSLKYRPEYHDALFSKALMHLKLEQKRQACRTWNKLIALKPDDKEVGDLIKKHCN